MSYDLYCYKSISGKVDLNEAIELTQIDDENEYEIDIETNIQIVLALLEFDNKMEGFDFDKEEINKLLSSNPDQIREELAYIELSTIDGDFALNIAFEGKIITISTPYWYEGAKAQEVFNKINEYLKIINNCADYFVYDPQSDQVFNPKYDNLLGPDIYINTKSQFESYIEQNSNTNEKKAWWKFW